MPDSVAALGHCPAARRWERLPREVGGHQLLVQEEPLTLGFWFIFIFYWFICFVTIWASVKKKFLG